MSRLEFCMAKKRYPVISIFVAVVWATFFYPQDKKGPEPIAAQPAAVAPAAQGQAGSAPTPSGKPANADGLRNTVMNPVPGMAIASNKSK